MKQALIAVALTAAATTGLPATDGPTAFRSRVDAVSLAVTVTDNERHLVRGLQQSDFVVFEDGVPQPLVYFAAEPSPIALSLLLDTSASMSTRLELAQEAASLFAREIKRDDLVQVIDFDNRVRLIQAFTNDGAAVATAIRGTAPGGGTSLFNAVYIALSELGRLSRTSPDTTRRHAIVLLSDGADTSSLVTYDQVLDQLKRLNVAIYSIGLRPPIEPFSLRPPGEADFVLKQFAQVSGGRAFFPDRAETLARIYAAVAEEIGSQYVLGYVPAGRVSRTGWRTISVRINRPDCVARTRAGYYASVK